MAVYQVQTKRGEQQWSINVTGGLPEGHTVFSHARTLDKVEVNARAAISESLGLPYSDVDIELEILLPAPIRRQVDALKRAKAKEAEAIEKRRTAMGAAVVELTTHLTQRDAAAVLGVSHQRVKQLLDEARAAA